MERPIALNWQPDGTVRLDNRDVMVSVGLRALLVAEAERARWDPPEPMEETEPMA